MADLDRSRDYQAYRGLSTITGVMARQGSRNHHIEVETYGLLGDHFTSWNRPLTPSIARDMYRRLAK